MEAKSPLFGSRYALHTLSIAYMHSVQSLLIQGEGKGEGQTEGKPEREKKEKEKSKSEIVNKPCLKFGHGKAYDWRCLALERVNVRNVHTSFRGEA